MTDHPPRPKPESEHKQFEEWCRVYFGETANWSVLLKRDSNGDYDCSWVQSAWEGWQARGTCAQEVPAPSAMRDALDLCRGVLADLTAKRDTAPSDGVAIVSLWARAVEAESNARAALDACPQKVKISGEMIEAAAKAIVAASFADDETAPWEAYEPHARAALKAALEAALQHQMTPTEIEAQRQSWVRGMTARCEHGVVDFEQCPQCRHLQEEGVGGLSERAVKLLGFDEMCQCGHDFGLHNSPGTECAVLDCKCGHFRLKEGAT